MIRMKSYRVKKLISNVFFSTQSPGLGLGFGLPSIKTLFSSCISSNHDSNIVKLINNSCYQQPIIDAYFGQVGRVWYPMKHQIKIRPFLILKHMCVFISELQ